MGSVQSDGELLILCLPPVMPHELFNSSIRSSHSTSGEIESKMRTYWERSSFIRFLHTPCTYSSNCFAGYLTFFGPFFLLPNRVIKFWFGYVAFQGASLTLDASDSMSLHAARKLLMFFVTSSVLLSDALTQSTTLHLFKRRSELVCLPVLLDDFV